MNIKGKNILIGITGGIAAYKITELIRMFKKQGANVKVVLTKNALQFVTKKTLETLTQSEVYINPFKEAQNTVHISLEDWADILVLAPISANTISKISNGIADNLLTSVTCAIIGTETPILLAPSMNTNMWNNMYLQENIKNLTRRCQIIEPEIGYLACGEEGKGRLPNIEVIFDETIKLLENNKPLKNKKIIITAGGTKEKIDPVRYISNSSSGKMGLALADCAYDLGAEVHLICTFDTKKDYKVTLVETALEMLDELKKDFKNCDSLIMASAVADYRIKDYNKDKISGHHENLTLELIKNPDILEEICKNKTKNQTVIGFCLSTKDPIECAKEKIVKKKCDYIISNEAKTALGTNENEIWIIDKKLKVTHIEKNSKENISKKILELIYD